MLVLVPALIKMSVSRKFHATHSDSGATSTSRIPCWFSCLGSSSSTHGGPENKPRMLFNRRIREAQHNRVELEKMAESSRSPLPSAVAALKGLPIGFVSTHNRASPRGTIVSAKAAHASAPLASAPAPILAHTDRPPTLAPFVATARAVLCWI